MTRLDQFLAASTGLSRKEAKIAISRGRVRVDQLPCRSASTKLSETSEVTLDGQPCTLPGDRYLMLNKPTGVVSATRDSEHPTALDLLPKELTRDLHIAGRLDLDTTGLLLLSSDGQWTHRVTSPRVHCPKTYLVTLDRPITETAVRALEQGLQLRNDPVPTRPAQVVVLEEKRIELTISEGRYHQVKRMMAATGNHVLALHRTAIGSIALDPALKPGGYRPLTADEIASIS